MNQLPRSGKTLLACLLAGGLALATPVAAADVRLEGLDKTQTINVLAYLQLDDLTCEAPAWEVENLARLAPEQVRNALEALGHYRAVVEVRDPPETRKCWRKIIDIQPGPLTTYDEVNVAVLGAAAQQPDIAKLLAASPLSVGAPLHHGRYETFKRRLQTLASERGYFDATLRASRIVVDKNSAHASVELILDGGERYRFGKVNYGEQPLDDDVFRRLLEVREGEPYDARRIAATHRNFLDSGFFGVVNVVADPANASGLDVPVTINTTEAKKRLYAGGVGYATDIGPRLRLNYRNRRVNRRGHTLEGQLQLSTAQSLIGTEYRIPFGDDRRDALSLRFGITQEDIATSNTDAYEFELRQTRAMENGWLRSLFVDARREFFRIADQDSSSTLVIPGINWWRITEKADPRPRSGYRMSVELRGTSTLLASDTSFVQAQAQAKHIHSFGERTRLLSRLSLGATWRDELRELPPSVRFFVGGDGSIRGYEYQSLGPRDADGVVVGGSNLLTGSLEIDYRLSNAWAVAAFVDSGSAFNATDVDFSTGAGVGLRWLTAIGPVRIDLATPFDLDRKLRLHLSIGADL